MLILSAKTISHFRHASLYIVCFHLSSIKSDFHECENKNLRRRRPFRRKSFERLGRSAKPECPPSVQAWCNVLLSLIGWEQAG